VEKLAKLANFPSFVALAFQNGLDYHNADFKMFICDDLATSCKNLVLPKLLWDFLLLL